MKTERAKYNINVNTHGRSSSFRLRCGPPRPVVALFAVPVLSLPLFPFCIEQFILCLLADPLSSSFVGVLSTSCSVSISYSELKLIYKSAQSAQLVSESALDYDIGILVIL